MRYKINTKTLAYSVCTILLTIVACKKTKEEKHKEAKVSYPILETGLGKTMPKIWIDKHTGHKITRLTDSEKGGRSFYFHNRPFLPAQNQKGWLMVFYAPDSLGNQLHTLNLNTGKINQITFGEGRKRGEIIGQKSRKAFYMVKDSIFSVDIDKKTTRFIAKFPSHVKGSITTLNASESLLGGAFIDKKEEEILKKHPTKRSYFERIYEAKLERSLITMDVETGSTDVILTENAWLNHIQFSPTDPKILMYCHEGPWHKVDRIWNIDIETKENKLMHKRTIHREIAGHEYFSPDGKTIWYDLQIPRGETFHLAGRSVHSDSTIKYKLKRDEWSIHFNSSPDQKTFAGDGGDSTQVARAKNGMWLYHFKPVTDSLQSVKLVNMKHHDYELEPNVHFTPDGRQVIFRANFEGKTHIYAVDLKKYHD
ncbi:MULTISPECIES: oligogalacturonate lyase family protein [Flavobacteriaceae]|uniref:oligogalacturonate lyase family protein n=1 Tax=Flavobacteriaceae TaxID=49546 RepID=UPI001492810E|nr:MULTISPECIES: oligogalacturonate lyase family protein [Allomuricauda]MDC6367627.1 oligogalacturonate lyase family protein [Muricauda sp. AC10]